MKLTYPCLTLSLLLSCLILSAQTGIRLKNGIIYPEANITETFINQFNTSARAKADPSYILLYFKEKPSQQQRYRLSQAGINLLQYIPANAFTAEVTRPVDASFLRGNGLISVIELKPEHKISSSLLQAKIDRSIEVLVTFFETVSYESAVATLARQGFIAARYQSSMLSVAQVKLPGNKLFALADLPFVQSVEPLPPPPSPLNFRARASSRSNILLSRLPGAWNLNGEGVRLNIGEIGEYVPRHIDYVDRQALVPGEILSDAHAEHVNGIAGGAGLVNELYTGHAPGVTIYASSSFYPQNEFNINSDKFVISNNSWGSGSVCRQESYNFNMYEIDYLATKYNYLLYVYAAGNSGGATCSPFPPGFGTVFSDDQSSKNILAVGSGLPSRMVSPASSKGPSWGRLIKPEIVAPGNTIFSTIGISDYGRNSGTSMAAPAVSGGLALLYQRYYQLHNGQNPKSALMKAIVCNSATDMGNKGPDYSYGFGVLNMFRAVQALDNHSYFSDSIADQSFKTHTITVPPGMAHLKVMLYWPDPPAGLIAGKVLVNDLDMQVTTPAASTVLPYVLDTLPANVANQATHGEDHINNIEQVIIDDPQPGTYTVRVKGTDIAQNPLQEYFVVYDVVPNDIQLTFPYGGEGLNTEEDIVIQWDAEGAVSTFKLEFSSDSGATWKNINTNIEADQRQYTYQLPFVTTSQAMIRLTRNSDGKSSISKPFVMVRPPVVSLASSQCPGYIALQWNATPGATDYEVMTVKNGKMITLDSTVSTNYVIKNLSSKVYWVTVRARVNGKPGRRSVAISRDAGTGNCEGNISDNDMRPVMVGAPAFGRILTSDSLHVEEPVRVRLKNFDDQPVTGYEIKYSVNNGAWVSEQVNTTIAAQAMVDHTFATPYDFSLPGTYEIKVVVKPAGDNNAGNDSLSRTVTNITNPALDVTMPVLDTFGLCPDTNFASNEGIWAGASRFDYFKLSGSGNLVIADRVVSPGGGKGFTLRQSQDGSHFVRATYNLSAYDTSQHEIALSFLYSKPATATLGNDKLWLRGSDKDTWIEIMNLDTAANIAVSNKLVRGISISGALKSASQNFSTSTQLRWSQDFSPGQYSFDSIALYLAKNDLELVSIDSFTTHHCGFGNAVPIRITLRNWTADAISNVAAKYRINNGNIISQAIPFVDPGANTQLVFTSTADLSAVGLYKIEAWLDMPEDKFVVNNSKTINVRNKGLITVYPYLQNFESSAIGWYSEGTNSSWQLGVPTSEKINTAASGTKAWKTNLSGNMNANERSYVYSPCFDLSNLRHPVISFSMSLDIDSCRLFCDHVRVNYSMNGTTWVPNGNMDAKGFKQWRSFTSIIPDTVKQAQVRFFMASDGFNNFEGLAIDDIHVYDSTMDIYDLPQNSQSITGTVIGNSWTNFVQDGKIIAAINANDQNIGDITVQAYWRNGPGDFHGQYYIGRSFSVQSENAFADSVTMRIYFLGNESEALMFSEYCNSCKKPLHAYRFGISVYNSKQAGEINGHLSDNINGDWAFIPYQRIKIVPYLKGYYAEFKVKNASELWLSNGGYDNNSPLPVIIPEFNATLLPSGDVELKWTSASEINITHFDIEAAEGNEAYANNLFEKQGEANSKGASAGAQQYSFLADGNNKTGVVYYRLKVVDESGNYAYSKVRPVVFSNEIKWVIAPNHSSGLYNLIYQANQGEKINIEIFNSLGGLVRKEQFIGTGFVTRHEIDLQRTSFAKGIYLVRVHMKEGTKTFRIVKK
jgi:hypothetical protein